MWSILVAGLVAAVVLYLVLRRPIRNRIRELRFLRARREFHQQRERLEAKFFELAGSCGKPRGLRWVECDFDDDVAYARDRRTGQLSAFVAVSITFDAIEGGGMEEVPAVHDIRAATAVFHYDRGPWYTHGRALFNLAPTEAIARYQHDFEMVGHEMAVRP